MELLAFAVVAAVSIFAVFSVYPIFSGILLDHVVPAGADYVGNHTEYSTQYTSATNILTQSWVWGPLILVLGLLAVVYLMSGRREYVQEAW